MADKLEVIKWDDPRLSTVCDKVDQTEFGDKLHEFGEQLIATMRVENGVGLAAPQVGILKRIFVMDFPEHAEWKPIVVCNPLLDLSGPSIQKNEGCLSFPGIQDQVVRAKEAKLVYTTPLGSYAEFLLTDIDARVAQHEFDHLNGIMFFDYKDKRPVYGARMSKQLSKHVLRQWEKKK